MSSSQTIYGIPQSRATGRYFTDENGIETAVKRYDEILGYAKNLTEWLASGESVSSVAYEDHGVTRSSASLSSPTLSFNVTGTGYVEITATLSTGRKLQWIVKWEDAEGPRASDYR